MRQNFEKIILTTLLCGLFLIPTLGCSANAQQYLSPGYIVTELKKGLGFQPMPETPPDFVVKGRPATNTLNYVPLKPPPSDFHSEEASPATRQLAEAGAICELEAARHDTQKASAKAKACAGARASEATDAPTKNWSQPPWSDD